MQKGKLTQREIDAKKLRAFLKYTEAGNNGFCPGFSQEAITHFKFLYDLLVRLEEKK